jgi:homoserine kinase type II
LAAEIDRLAACWPPGLPSGPIHADYFPDNVLFVDGRVGGVIDWWFACTDAFAYDLAVALNAWGFRGDGTPDPDGLAAFVRGYGSARPLSPAEVEALPTLSRGAAVRFTLTRLHDVLHHDPAWRVTPKDPLAFYRRLEFHRTAGASAYGLATVG